MEKNTNNILYIVIGLLVVALVVAFFSWPKSEAQLPVDTNGYGDLNGSLSTQEEPKQYKGSEFVVLSKENLLQLLQQQTQATTNPYVSGLKSDRENMAGSQVMYESTDTAMDYSGTNVQVQGIDEGDVVKTNGEKIFIGKYNKLVVINDVTPPIDKQDIYDLEISKATDTYEYYTAPQENIKTLLLDNDLLYLVTTRYNVESRFEGSVLYPQMINIPTTVVTTYKIRDDSLEKLSAIEVSGEYYQSRQMDGYVYLITNTNSISYSNPKTVDDLILNPITETGNGATKETERTIIMPRDGSIEAQNLYTITTIKYNDSGNSVVDTLDILLDYSSTIYMSENNLYIAHKKMVFWGPWYFRGYYNNNLEVFKEIYKEVYPSSVQRDIETNLENPESLITVLNDYYNTLDADGKEALYKKLSEATEKYYQEQAKKRQKTSISKIELLDNGKLGDVTTGFVDGELLNQFSLDEDEQGYLRVAVTYMDEEYKNNSGIVILDPSLEQYSLLDGLAQDERIYSVRFMGDKVFLVTYRQVDPFFVIDLSDRKNPEVLGYLKIPGYSSYLHPISDTLILGVGQDTKQNEWGGVSTEGVKVSLFDVSDYSNPQEVASFKVDAENSYTPIQNDHKAFLYIQKNNLIVIPVNEYFSTRESEVNFYILEVTQDSIQKKAVLTHNQGYSDILRSLYIDEELYTISGNYIATYNFGTQETTKVSI